MSEGVSYAAGMRVLCRDAEWLVTKAEPSGYSGKHYAVHCIGADDLVRGHQAIFLTQLDSIEPVDPRRTLPVADSSSGYRLARLFLEAQLRQMPAAGVTPDLAGMGVFKPMKFQIEAVEWALRQLRPRLLLADAVGLGKTIQVGMILSELMRRRRADRILVLARKSMLTQFQSELWNRFGIPLVRLDSEGIARLRLRIPANKNPFEVYHRIIISIDTLKNVGSYRHFLENTRWDCVVIDEAHNVAGASVPERHLSYRLARLLARGQRDHGLAAEEDHAGHVLGRDLGELRVHPLRRLALHVVGDAERVVEEEDRRRPEGLRVHPGVGQREDRVGRRAIATISRSTAGARSVIRHGSRSSASFLSGNTFCSLATCRTVLPDLYASFASFAAAS